MTRFEAIQQLARILGRDDFARQLGLPPGQLPPSLTPEQATTARALTAARADDIARALLEEAVACDDVIDAASALAYLEDRLAFLAELLSEETRSRVRERYEDVARGWG